MPVVYKYVLPTNNTVSLQELPKGAKVLSIGRQEVGVIDRLCMWVLVDPTIHETETRVFVVTETGVPLEGLRTVGGAGVLSQNCTYTFLGTAMFNNTHYVVHVFEAHAAE